MRASLFGITACLLLANGLFRLHAQTNGNANVPPPNPQIAREMQMLSFLTPAEQEKYAKARAKALQDNPDLKAEGEKVEREGINALTADATVADKQAFIEKMSAHRQKLRQAMLKEDPSLGPVFAKIDKHIAEMKAQQHASSGAANAPTAGSASQ